MEPFERLLHYVFLLSVLIFRDSAKILQALLVEHLRNAKLRSRNSPGRRQKKTLLPDAEVDNVLGSGESFVKHLRKARGIFNIEIMRCVQQAL